MRTATARRPYRGARSLLKSWERHPGAKKVVQDVSQKHLINHQMSVVAIGHDDEAGFPWYRRYGKRRKPRITSTVHDEVAVLCVSYLPAQRLRNRVIDFRMRPEHFRKA